MAAVVETNLQSTPPELLTAADVAKLCGVSVKTIGRWRRLGILPEPRKLGPKAHRYARDEILAWITTTRERGARKRPTNGIRNRNGRRRGP